MIAPETVQDTAEEIFDTLDALFEHGDVVEMRAFKGRSISSGYYDVLGQLAYDAAKLDKAGYTVYITVNRLNPALLARAANRYREVVREPTTSDSPDNIEGRRWFLIDFDPRRPAGTSATDEEHQRALDRANEVKEFLRKRGWTDPIEGDSGNGAHLLYLIDRPNDDESRDLIKGALEALSFEFSDGEVEVDTGVYNASRIWKLYGTTARKGDDLRERPHRRSRLVHVPDGARDALVTSEQLEELAGITPDDPAPRADHGRDGWDPARWIEEHGVPIKREGPWKGSGRKWVLEECPWNGHTDGSAHIEQHPSGAVSAGCHHNSCQEYGWRDLRLHYEPDAYDNLDGFDELAPPDFVAAEERKYPKIDEAAFYGLAGRIVKAFDPTTEADPVAVLVNTIVAFGNIIGTNAWLTIGTTRHYLKLFACLVGETSKGRKGTSWSIVERLVEMVDELVSNEPTSMDTIEGIFNWHTHSIHHGLSTGEGLIELVRDKKVVENADGTEKVVDEGAQDKRAMIIEEEFVRVLKVMARDTNTLSPILRTAWDKATLSIKTRQNPLNATGCHISVIGHITDAELLRHLTETDQANGFGNRILFPMVRRSKELPEAMFGELTPDAGDLKRLVRDLKEAILAARDEWKTAGELRWAEEAKALWYEAYSDLSAATPGLFGAITGRGEAQVPRIAALYALLDKSRVIERVHLEAAVALWRYCEDSARYIFGDATGDPTADQILEGLRMAGSEGMTRTGIDTLLGKRKGTDEKNRALGTLFKAGKAKPHTRKTGGRPVERWYYTAGGT